MKFTRKNFITTTMILIIAVGMGLGTKQLFFSGGGPQYEFDTAKKDTVTQLVTVNGSVITPGANEVFSPTNGVIDQIYVKNGDTVNGGDKLFTVRSTATPAEQAAADANYQAALSAVTAAKNTQQSLEATAAAKEDIYATARDAKEYKSTHPVNPVTGVAYTVLEQKSLDSAVVPAQKEWDAAKQAYNTAAVAIRSAQSQAHAASLAYEATKDATVTAPVAGTVGNVAGMIGMRVGTSGAQQAQSGSNASVATGSAVSSTPAAAQANASSAGSPVLIIGTSNEYAIRALVNEVDVNKVAIGQPTTIHFSAVSGQDYTGAVTQIDPYGTTTQGLTTYEVLLSITNPDKNIKPHMSATLTINTAEHKDVLTVANSAIVPHQNEKAVQILDDQGNVVFKPVKVGLKGFTRSEILSGLNPGTQVILGNTNLTNESGGASGVLGY